MGNDFLGVPLQELRRKLDSLKDSLETLATVSETVAEIDGLETSVTARAEEVRDEHIAAELTEALPNIQKLSGAAGEAGQSVRNALMQFLRPIDEALSKASAAAEAGIEGVEPVVAVAARALENKMAALAALSAQANEVLEEKERAAEAERQRLMEPQPPEVEDQQPANSMFEETMPFEASGSPDDEEPSVREAEEQDRRRHPRDDLAINVKLSEHNRLLSGPAENLSVGGVFVGTPRPFELGTLLHVVCELPDGGQVKTEGVVSWVRDSQGHKVAGMGVEFLFLSEEDRETLEELARLQA